LTRPEDSNGAAGDAEFVRQESLFGRLPLLPSEREYGHLGAHSTCCARTSERASGSDASALRAQTWLRSISSTGCGSRNT
jgi:hypothetical protein